MLDAKDMTQSNSVRVSFANRIENGGSFAKEPARAWVSPHPLHINQFMCTGATQCKRETTVGADFTAVSQKTDQLFLHVPSGAESAAEQRQSSVILRLATCPCCKAIL